MPRPSRRDFLKLGSLLSGALAASQLMPGSAHGSPASGTLPSNIIIFVFDAMSAKNLSLYGYPRKTTPNLERFAARATVYNQHYAPDNFTTPGTASILTGLYPWTHRAINESGLITHSRAQQNLFNQVGGRYYRIGFSQNVWVDYFFGQFGGALDKVLSPGSFSLVDQVVSARFTGDLENSHRAFDDLLFHDKHAPASLVFGLAQNIQLYEAVVQAENNGDKADVARADNYPIFFRTRDVFDGMLKTISGLKAPFLAYFHTWSPHSPYLPSHDFAKLFDDDWEPISKPEHVLGEPKAASAAKIRRKAYDRYIANVDFEFGRLLEGLQANGVLDQSYVVVTSDHGEMFERGILGHVTPVLYDPVVRVPLMISAPGQTRRRDVDLPTSSVDLLPTLVQLTGGEVPAWAEGRVLPGFGAAEDADRSIFISEAKDSRPFEAWSRASFALRKGKHKLIYYMGFEQYARQDKFELYDIDSDPEELQDLYSEASAMAQDLRHELLARVTTANEKYRPAG